jgi:hypothetical protein
MLRWLRARRHRVPGAPKRALFVVGCQRSGTNMLMWTLERSPHVWVYHEHAWSPAFRRYRLRPTATIERLVRRAPANTVAFKPICDSHLVDRLLARHPGSLAIWIFRNYRDVANSMAQNFPGHAREILRWIVEGDTDLLGWRGERLAPEAVEVVRACYRPEMSVEEAAAVVWWLRNRFFFDLALEKDPRVRLAKYEDLVAGGEEPFRRLFDFAGVPFDSRLVSTVFDTSVGKRPSPVMAPRLVELCDELLERLERAHAKAVV